MKKINYKDDFDFFLTLTDCSGNEIGVPDYDWTARFYTASKAYVFTASRIQGSYTNCVEENGQLHIVCNNHGLPAGVLRCEFTAELPNDLYPDEAKRIVVPKELEIELVRGTGDCPHDLEAKLILPYIKGEKGDAFTYEDFTPGQIADLKKPALEAAERADDAAKQAAEAAGAAAASAQGADTAAASARTATAIAEGAEAVRSKNENDRIANEEARKNDEAKRKEAEAIRVRNETERIDAEAKRAASESERENAEKARKSDESARKSNEQGRVSAEEVREENESARIAEEQRRTSAERARQTAEEARVTEFAQIKGDAETATENANEAAAEANAAAANANTVAGNLQEELEDAVHHEETDAELEEIEPNIVRDALRKTAQALTSGEQAQVLENLGNPERKVFIDMWNAAAGSYGKYNEETGYFELNGLTDITYEQALVIDKDSGQRVVRDFAFMYSKARTFYELRGANGAFAMSPNYCFAYCSNLEILRVTWYTGVNGTWSFRNCDKLRKIYGGISGLTSHLNNHPLLTYAEIIAEQNINLGKSPLLVINTFKYIIKNARNPTAITITVHADVYAKLTGDETKAAYNNLPDEEKAQWTALIGLAAEKNIQFASA